MGRLNKNILTSVLIFFVCISATAQNFNSVHSKNWIPDRGYWVIESNIHSPKTNTFYFYNDNDSLIYTEKIENKRVKIKSRATLRKLKNLLDNSLLAWDKINMAKADGSLVETILKTGKDSANTKIAHK